MTADPFARVRHGQGDRVKFEGIERSQEDYKGLPLADNQPPPDAWKYERPGNAPVRRLALSPQEEEHRRTATQEEGYCVDELCACDTHECATTGGGGFAGGFGGGFDNNNTDDALIPPPGHRLVQWGPDGRPVGLSPQRWSEFVIKYGVPTERRYLPEWLFSQQQQQMTGAQHPGQQYLSADSQPSIKPGFRPIRPDDCIQPTEFGPDGVPIGADPLAWKKFLQDHGIPLDAQQLPASLFYKNQPESRDFATEHREEYTAKIAGRSGRQIQYGPDGIPLGIDPQAWREYVAKHGLPTDESQIPAYLYYKAMPETRDFSTEFRKEYTPKAFDESAGRRGIQYGPDGIPIGVDPTAWREYVAKHGLPVDGQIPAYLFYKSMPETRDFATEQRKQYQPKCIEGSNIAGFTYGPDGVPIGVDPKAWREYVAKHGLPEPGQTQSPAISLLSIAPSIWVNP